MASCHSGFLQHLWVIASDAIHYVARVWLECFLVPGLCLAQLLKEPAHGIDFFERESLARFLDRTVQPFLGNEVEIELCTVAGQFPAWSTVVFGGPKNSSSFFTTALTFAPPHSSMSSAV